MLCSEVFARFQSGMTAFFCLYRLDLPICTPNVRVVDCRGGSPAEFASDRRRRRSGTNGFIRGFCIRLHYFSGVFSMYSCMFFAVFDASATTFNRYLRRVEIQYMFVRPGHCTASTSCLRSMLRAAGGIFTGHSLPCT